MFTSSFETVDGDGEWISVSDLMAALMVVFLFIAIIYIKPLAEQRRQVREIAVAWQESEKAIHNALRNEFSQDLERWDAELDAETLLIRFRSPEILFEGGRDDLKPGFKSILNEFFPRYVGVLKAHRENIEEIRVEGHTSSEWRGVSSQAAYFQNMKLSQSRTRSVLEFVMRSSVSTSEIDWLRPLVTANGLSSSHLITTENGSENTSASRRVEFRVRTKTRVDIVRILETVE